MKPTDVVAIVLAGGSSSRMWPIRDKHLLPFAGRTLVEIHLERLRRAGVGRAIIVASETNRDTLAREVGAEATGVVQGERPGMAGAVLSALDELSDTEAAGPVYITQPHDLVDPSFHTRMLQAATRGDSFGYLAGYVAGRYFAGGYLREADGRVVGIVEKPVRGEEPSDLVTIVAHLLSDARPLKEALREEAASEGPDDAYERALDRLTRDHHIEAVRYEGSWAAIKYPWHVLDVTALLLQQIQAGEIEAAEGYSQVESGVFIGRDVKMLPGAHVAAPSVIGHNVVVGNNALVRESIVGDGCVVGFGSEVARSYLGPGCQLHANYVGDSVLEEETLLGFGAVTANFRLDGKSVKSTIGGEGVDSDRTKLGMIMGAGAKAGVNASIMPGVKVGASAVIGPGQTVFEDVPDGETLTTGRGL